MGSFENSLVICSLYLIVISYSLGVSGALSKVDKKNVVQSTGNFLRLNLVPEYFKGVIYSSNSVDVGFEVNGDYLHKLSHSCRLHYETWLDEIQRNYEHIISAQNWALKSLSLIHISEPTRPY